MKTVSIVIPTHNAREDYLERALISCLTQTVLPLEILVIEDPGDVNRGGAVVAKLHSPLIHYHELSSHLGPGMARQTGNGLAQGDYIIYLDDDDVLARQTIEVLQSILSEDFDVAFFSHGRALDNASQVNNDLNFPVNAYHGLDASKFLCRLYPGFVRTEMRSVWAKAFKRSFLRDNGIEFSSASLGEDQIFMQEVSFCVRSVVSVPSFISYYYRENDSSVSVAYNPHSVDIFTEVCSQLRASLIKRPSFPLIDLKWQEYYYVVCCEHLSRLLRFTFCNYQNLQTRINRFSEARKVAFKNPFFMEAIRKCRFSSCPTRFKKLQLFLLKCHILLPLFLLYEARKRNDDLTVLVKDKA